jgi:hypothetical protein
VLPADLVLRDPSVAASFGYAIYHSPPPNGGWFVSFTGSEENARKLGARLFRELIPLSKIAASTPWLGNLPLWIGTKDGSLVRVDPPEKKARPKKEKPQLVLDRGVFSEHATTVLRALFEQEGHRRGVKLSSRFDSSDGNAAMVAAAHLARRDSTAQAVYRGKRGKYLVSTEESGDHLDPTKNTGSLVIIVEPDLKVTHHTVERGSTSNPGRARRMMNPRNY